MWHRAHPKELIAQTKSPSDQKGAAANHEGQGDQENGAVKTVQHDMMAQLSVTATAERDPYLGKGTPSKAQFRLFTPNANPFKALLLDFWIPWRLFAFPIVEFSAFVVSWTASRFLTINLTQSQVFAAPPYNLSSQSIGFTNFAVLIGAFIGLATNGPLSDWIAARATKKNRGVREPVMRLPTMIPYVCLMILGNFVVAFGYQQKWDWKPIVLIGYTCAGIQVATLPAISSTYAVDSYKPVAGSVFVAIIVNKNVWGYGFSKFITPWTLQSGFVPPIMTNMPLTALFCLTDVGYWYAGKTFSRWSRGSSVHAI